MVGKSALRDFSSGLIEELADSYAALALLFFAVANVYVIFVLFTSWAVFDIPNIFISSGIPTERRAVEVLGFRFDYLYVLISLQFLAAYIVSGRKRKRVNALLLVLNVFTRFLFSLHLPMYLSDIFRNELYGELAVRGYNPYLTYLDEGIPFVKEYAARGLPTGLWPQFTFTYPTFTATYFLALCSVFPGYGYWQEVFILLTTSMLDVLAGLLIGRIHGDGEYRYAVLYVFFPPILTMALEGQIEAIPNFLTFLSYYYLTRKHRYRPFLSLALAFQSKFYPLAWLPVILYKSEKKIQGLLCFALVASLMSIPFITSPDYFRFFNEMTMGQPYFFRITDWVFAITGLFLALTRRNILYLTIFMVFGALCISSFVPLWYYLWIVPTAFILVKSDWKTFTALMLYLIATASLLLYTSGL